MEKNKIQIKFQSTLLSHSARPFFKIGIILAAVAFTSCITVNVNFPETAVQQAANDFVKDLYKSPVANTSEASQAAAASETVKNTVKKSSHKKTKAPAAEEKPSGTSPSTWNFSLFTEAYAQEINTSSPKANEIRNRMRARVDEVRKWKTMGVVCETSDAMLVVKHPEKAGGNAAAAEKFVREDNADRDALYQEIAEVNRITDRKQTKIRKFFAAAFRQHSPPGTCFEE